MSKASEMNIRSRFAELLTFLKNKGAVHGIPPENFDAETASMTLESGGRNLTECGWHLANMHYSGAILIERIPRAIAVLLLLHCRTWLDDHDDTRQDYRLPEPVIGMVPLAGDDLVDLILNIEFIDPVFITESKTGEISWNGRTFSPVPFDLLVAERGRVNGTPPEPKA